MAESGGIRAGSGIPADYSSPSLKQKLQTVGKAFRRKVLPHKARKQLALQQQPLSKQPRSLQSRKTESVPAQKHLAPPPLPPRSGKTASFSPAGRSSGAGAALYSNLRYRNLVAQERVTQQFEQPRLTSKNLKKAAWDFFNQGKNGPWGQNPALQTKGVELGQVSKGISAHDRALGQPLSKGAAGVEQQGRQVIDNLQDGINHLDHLVRQQGHRMPLGEQQYLYNIRTALHSEQKLMLQLMEDPGAASLSGSLDLRQAMELKRLGYDLNPELEKHFSALNDSQLIKGSDQAFGSGAIHSVTKLKFQTPSGVVEKIFKGEDAVDPCPFDSITGPENYLDKNKPRFAARNFAAAKFDDLLGCKLMPKMEMTVHNGQLGVLMDVAKGVKPFEQHSGKFNWVPVEDKRQPQKAAFIQQQLNSAEWLDGICAQQDRHAGNLFVDPDSGKVTLIDNDMGFYPGQSHVRSPSKNPRFRRFSGSTAGKPAVIDAQVYKKLMSITPAKIHEQMDGLLNRTEIQSTISRIEELQSHAKKLAKKGRVINDWQQWRDPSTGMSAAKYQRRKAPDSYLLSVQGQSKGL